MRTALPPSLAANPMLDRWIAIGEAGRVTVRSGKVELGQGTTTAIAAIAAGELGVRLDQVDIRAGDTRETPDEGWTAGSLSIEQGGRAMQWAAATARALFAEAAADTLRAGLHELTVNDGVFSVPGRNESVDYWTLAARVNLARSLTELPVPAMTGTVAEGAALRRLDLPTRLSGAAFIHDMDLPGMHYGRVLRTQHPKARLVHLDPGPLRAMPGVREVVIDGSFVGVVAARDEQAIAAVAKAASLAQWSRVAELPADTPDLGWLDDLSGEPIVLADDPAPPVAPATRLKRVYSRPYIAHASIGPSCALARWTEGRLEVWSHSQGVFQLRGALARALRLADADIEVAHRPGAGCYGHNGADDVALDAALLARAAGVPVLCQWSRAEEFSAGPLGAAMRVEIEAGLDEAGRIACWSETVTSPPHVARPTKTERGVGLLAAWHRAEPMEPAPLVRTPQPSGAGDRNAIPIYTLPGRRIVHRAQGQGPLRSSALRALGAHCNVFAIESMMDELAEQAGADPVAFRLSHLEDGRGRAVLERAARLAGWVAGAPAGTGSGRGIGFARYKSIGAWCAVVADVELTERVRLVRLIAAVDCGRVVFRDGVVNQIEGGMLQAASWTLEEAVHWSDDGVTTLSFADYPILGFARTPTLTVELVERADDPPLGAGECAAGPTAAAIGNAIAHALGARARRMPLTPDNIARAIEQGDGT